MNSMLEDYVDFLSQRILEYSPRIATSVGVLLVALLISVAFKRMIVALAAKNKFSGQKLDIAKLIAGVAGATIMIIGIVSSVGTLGVDVSALIAGLGLSGFAIGFALRDALSNLLSGILIIFYQPFRTGDRITVTGFEGDVVEINLRYTVLRTEENSYLIPNSNIFNNTVTVRNKTKSPKTGA